MSGLGELEGLEGGLPRVEHENAFDVGRKQVKTTPVGQFTGHEGHLDRRGVEHLAGPAATGGRTDDLGIGKGLGK